MNASPSNPNEPGSPGRRIEHPDERSTLPLEHADGVWHVRSHAVARELLRVPDGLRQSGFNADFVIGGLRGLRLPILYAFGAEHRTQRAAVARYFAPKTVDERYRGRMQETADRLVAQMLVEDITDFTDVADSYSVEIAATILGLRVGDLPGLSARLRALFAQPVYQNEAARAVPQKVSIWIRGHLPVLKFWWHDVRHAVRARKKNPQADVISHLLDSGYSQAEIVTECVTYAAAGMVTTREFVQVALWHLLTDEPLRTRFREGDSATKQSVLWEILRMEPVVGLLSRRAAENVTVSVEGGSLTVAAGERVVIEVRATNVDPDAFAPDPERLRPGRATAGGVRPEGLGFGEGAHRCPGNALAMVETETMLSRLFEQEVDLVRPPDLGWEEIVAGYTLTGLQIRVRD